MSGFSAAPKDIDNTNEVYGTNKIDFNDLVIDRDNMLLKYDNVAWKFKLFTMSVNDMQKYQSANDRRVIENEITEYVISETGATGKYSIDDVEIKTVAPGTYNTKNSTLQQVKLTMSENGSMRFFDDLQAASFMLGYTTVMDIPLFLELSFKGYDRENGNQPVTIPNTSKIWRVRFNKIDTRLENTGGTSIYDITMSPMTFVTPPDDWRLTEQIELIAKSNVTSFIDKFSQKLNAIHDSQYGYLTHMFPSKLQSDNYFTFHVHPRIGELVLINDTKQDTAKDKVDDQGGSKKFVFKASDTIGNCIDMVMDSAQARDDTNQIQKRQFVNVVPVSYYVGYDRFRKKHVYRYEIYILPFRTLDYQDVDDTNNKNTAFDLKELLDEAYPDLEYNMKRYDYQWSGLNTEILELDMEFNSAYNVLAPKNLTSKFDPYNRRGEKSPDLKPEDQIASPQRLQELYLRKQELESKANRSEEENTELQQTTVTLDNTSLIEGETSQSKSNSSDTVYLENINNDIRLDNYTQTYDGNNMSVQVQVDYQNVDEISSGTDDSNASQTELAKRMIKSNYYNDAFLMKLNMNVVGDPYWLGKSELDLIEDMKQLIAGSKLSNDPDNLSMNVLNCEPCLLLNLHPTRGFSEYTGLMEEDPESVFAQGVYRVLTVVSRFDAGSFTQDLEAAIITRSVNRKR